MVESICFNIFERFSAHRWAKSRHVLLIALWVSSCLFAPKTAFSEKDNTLRMKNRDNTTFKKISVFFLGLSFCFLCFSIVGSGLSSGATVYVDTDGSGDYNCDGTNDHVELNKALAYIDSIGGGTVYLRGPNTYWIDSTLKIGANTILTGDSTAEIKLVANAGWSSEVPMMANMGTDGDITVTGFIIDGNSENQGVSLGAGYYNMMRFEGGNNIEVSHMRLEWGCGDGLQVRKASNIKFTNNDVYKLGHDVLYALGCRNVEFAYNTVYTRTNSACRLADGNTNSIIHDNFITGESTGPGIQIGTSATTSHVFDDIEVYNNHLYSLKGSGIWITANYQDNVVHARDVYIHHNIFTKVGQYNTNTGYSNAGITLGDFDNTIIENNVFDDGGHAAIKYYLRPDRRQQQTQFTTYVRNNIIMNSDGVSSVTGSGVGIWNTNPTYSKFVVQNNNFYNNKNGDTYGGSITMSNNLNGDPQCADPTNSNIRSRDYHLKSKAGRYSNGKWVTDAVSSPLIDAGYSGSAYSSEPSPNGGRINIGRYGNTGQASRSGSTVPNQIDAAPVANAGADKTATAGSSVNFDGSASTDDKGVASYSWDFDASNGITSEATGKTTTKTYTNAGTYTVTLTVTDTAGQTATDTVNVVVSGTTTPTGPTTPTNPTTPTDPATSTPGSVSYSAAYDNRLRESLPTTVLPSSNFIDIGRLGTSSYRDVMMFDLSGYSTTDTISKATLSLYWYYESDTRTSDTVVEIYRPAEWDPKYVSWNNRASGTVWSTAGGNWYDKNGVAQGSTPYASLTFPAGTAPGNKYYEFDVTQLVQEYISGKSKNTGFFIKAKTENGNYIAFYSSDWSNSAQRPKLTVSSTAGSSQPADNVQDNAPVGNAGDDQTAAAGSAVSFNGGASSDDKGIASYSWDFDASNGITSEATGVTATYTYGTAGNYVVTLTVTDTNGQTSTDTMNVVVTAAVSADVAPIANAGDDQTAAAGSAVSFNGGASSDDKGVASYSWDFDASNGITSEATGKTTTKTYTTAGTYTVTLTVTDTAGQTATDTVTVVVSGTTTPTNPTTSSSVSHSVSYDNRLIESYPSTVYSSLAYLDIGKSSTRCRDLMIFDLSGYSTKDTISKATLSLYWYYPSDRTRASDTVVEVYRPVEWDPKYVSWNNRASGTSWGTAGGNWYDKNGIAQGSTPYASLTFPASKLADNKYYELDVTELVQEYISGKSKNTGFFLKAKTESGDYISFYSSDSSTAARRPTLTITK